MHRFHIQREIKALPPVTLSFSLIPGIPITLLTRLLSRGHSSGDPYTWVSAGEGPGACAGEQLHTCVTQGDPDEDRGLGVQYLPTGNSQKATEGPGLLLYTGSHLSSMSKSQSQFSKPAFHFTTSHKMSLLVISFISLCKIYTLGCVEYHHILKV